MEKEFVRYVAGLSIPRTREHTEKVIELLWVEKLNDICDIGLLAARIVVFRFPRIFPFISGGSTRCELEKRDIPGIKIINGKVKVH